MLYKGSHRVWVTVEICNGSFNPKLLQKATAIVTGMLLARRSVQTFLLHVRENSRSSRAILWGSYDICVNLIPFGLQHFLQHFRAAFFAAPARFTLVYMSGVG